MAGNDEILPVLAIELREDEDDLTDEQRAEIEARREREQAEREAYQQRLQAFGQGLLRLRREAIDGRLMSGIDDIWREDEEAYEGIDDANRDEEHGFRVRKPTEGGAPSPSQKPKTRSTAFVNITAQFVDTAASRVGDMLLPVDDRPWRIEPTPLPTLPGTAPESAQQTAQAQAASAGEPAPAESAQESASKALMTEARRRAEEAEKQIDDWHSECQFNSELRTVIDDSARIGTGIIKGPVPARKRKLKWVDGPFGKTILAVDEIQPASYAISAWNFFPDPRCGESIHNGNYVWERDPCITAKMLADLRFRPGYLIDQIEAALEEGPQKHTIDGMSPEDERRSANEKPPFELWIFYGNVEREDLVALGIEVPDRFTAQVPVMCEFVNDRIIKIAFNPLDDGQFPYDLLPWKRRRGMPWGKGVARQVRTPQRMVNAAMRAIMDNASLSAGVILFLRRLGLSPADGDWNLGPNKIYTYNSAEIQDVEKSVHSIEIPNRQKDLMPIVEQALRLAEQVTGLPMLLQGQQGAAPDTVGVTTLLYNSANGLLRRIAKLFDDKITEPHLRRWYRWLLEYSDNPEQYGDCQIVARGSSALVERDMQAQFMVQLAPHVKDPEFGINPRKWMQELCKAQRIDPTRIEYTEAELQEIKNRPQPVDPRIEAAKISAQARIQSGQEELAARREIAYLEYALKHDMTLAQAKMAMLELLATDRRERDLFAAERLVKEEHGTGISDH